MSGTNGNATPGRTWFVEVVVLPKEGVNDPEGEAILGGLRSLGYGGVTRVRAGRLFQVELVASDAGTARAAVVRMCEQLLANPVIQSFEVQVVDPAVVGAPER